MSTILDQFRTALQALNDASPQSKLSPEQEELNKLRMSAAKGVADQSVPMLGGRDQFLSALQGISQGISQSNGSAGSGLIGAGGGLVQGVGSFQAQQRQREMANVNNNNAKLQLLNQTKFEQPESQIGSAANLATAAAADERATKEIESRERIAKSKFEAELAKAQSKEKPKFEDILKVKDRYDKETEQTTNALKSKRIVDEASQDPTGMKLVGAAYSFLKAIDSDSVVRPSELELATGTVSTLSTLSNTVEKFYKDGKPMPQEVVNQLKPAMDSYFQAALERQMSIDDKWTKFANRNNIPVEDVVYNEPFKGLNSKAKSAAPRQAQPKSAAPLKYPDDPAKQARWEAFYNSKMMGQ